MKNRYFLRCFALFLFAILIVTPITSATATKIDVFDEIGSVSTAGDRYENFTLFSGGLQAVRQGDKWGYVDTSGKLVLDFIYDTASPFVSGVACVTQDGKTLVINTRGVVQCDLSGYDTAENAGDGTFIVSEDGKYGVATIDGAVKIALEWDSISRLSGGYHVVTKDGKYGYTDAAGRIVLEPQFAYACSFSDGAAYVETTDGGHQLIDSTGRVLLTDAYSGIHDDLVMVQRDGLWGFVDKSGDVHVECVWDDVAPPSEGLVMVCKDDLWGFADYRGSVVIEPQWEFIWSFSNDIAVTMVLNDETGESEKYGFINKIGVVVKEPQYGKLLSFTEGYGAFFDEKTGLWGYLDQSGNMVIAPAFDEATPFSNDFAAVRKGESWSLIDKTGKTLTISSGEKAPASTTTGASSEIDPPKTDLKPGTSDDKKDTPDFRMFLALILSVGIIGFLIWSLTKQSMEIAAKRRRKPAQSSANYEEDYEEENFFRTVMDLDEKKVQKEDYDSFDISEYYDDLSASTETNNGEERYDIEEIIAETLQEMEEK